MRFATSGVVGALALTSARGLFNDIYFQVGLLTTIGLSAKNAILCFPTHDTEQRPAYPARWLLDAVATLAGGWIVRANQIGRAVAILVFLLLGLTLLFPRLAEFISRPFVRLGAEVQGQENGILTVRYVSK